MEGNSVLRIVFNRYFLNFNDKTENFCIKAVKIITFCLK